MKRVGLLAISLVLTVGACGGSKDETTSKTATSPSASVKTTAAPVPTPTTPSEPQTVEGARAFAEESAARFAAQDFGGSWDQWDARGQAEVRRDEYVQYAEECNLGGARLNVDDIRLDSPTKATVRYEYEGFTQARTLIYEDGRWRAETTADTRKLFKGDGSATEAVKRAKADADGGC